MTATALPDSVWIFGAKGMLAGELLRLLDMHPAFELRGAVSRSEQSVVSAHPHLATRREDVFGGGGRAAIASALARGEGRRVPRAAARRVVRVVERSASELGARDEERLRRRSRRGLPPARPEALRAGLRAPHPAPKELEHFVYGLVEFHRAAIRRATRVAAPGCFATALQLACVPAARAKLLDTTRPGS
jgi:N-acetyl-gamma-glutamyl-phosphate/LysW-gamma-L-alpha-aminoadipyl-6-phosphate reductase